MAITAGLMSSATDEWATPKDFFDALNKQYKFTLDPCATKENHKCDKYFTREENGLLQSWEGETVFCNPPYGREIGLWVKKAHDEPNTQTVMLLPARTDTRWFHDYIYHSADKIVFIKGRLKFGGGVTAHRFRA